MEARVQTKTWWPGRRRRRLLSLSALLILVGAAGCDGTSGQPPALAAASTASPTVSGTGSTDAGSASSTEPPAAPSPAAPRTPPAAVTTPPPTVPSAGALSGRTILLDAGHDGGTGADPARANALVEAGGFRKACNTSGTSTNAGYAEHAFNYDVVNRTAALLRTRGATVVLTRNDDVGFGPCVDERAAIANAAHADAAVSVHADGGPASGQGFHVIAPALAPDGGNAAFLDAGYRLALSVRTAFQAATAEPTANYVAQNGLDRRSDLAGLNLARLPAVFIECGNMRNDTDAAHVTSPVWRQRAATGVADALQAFLTTP